MAVPTLGAQTSSATGSRQATVKATLQAPLGQILKLRKVGDPVTLADGRIEQRYVVAANVPFRLTSDAPAQTEVRCVSGATEVVLGECEGRPGFHDDVRIRSTGNTLAAIGVEPTARAKAGAN